MLLLPLLKQLHRVGRGVKCLDTNRFKSKNQIKRLYLGSIWFKFLRIDNMWFDFVEKIEKLIWTKPTNCIHTFYNYIYIISYFLWTMVNILYMFFIKIYLWKMSKTRIFILLISHVYECLWQLLVAMVEPYTLWDLYRHLFIENLYYFFRYNFFRCVYTYTLHVDTP